MRRRLLTLLLALLAGLLTAVLVPLAQSYAAQRSQEFHITRLGDTARFAALSEDALRSGRSRLLREEIARYDRLYDVVVVIVDVDARPVVTSRAELDGYADAEVARRVDAALAGLGGDAPDGVWPWDTGRHVIAEPVGRDSQVLGAVVTLSATDAVRADVRDRMALLAALGLGVSALLALLVAVPLVRWMLRPVDELDAAAHEITEGRLDARVPPGHGPDELRRLAASFNAMADSVSAALEQQRVFVADASHQLRNPLLALRLRVENLDAHVDADGRGELREAVAETERLAGLVDSLLRLARAEATRAETAPADLAVIVADRIAAWRGRLGPVTADVPPAAVAARRDVVEHVLDVLLDNAATHAGGAPVSVTAEPDGGDVVLRVRDRGPGLHPDDLDRAGERFFRGRDRQNVPGTGLGLAIAGRLVGLVGGSLTVENAEPGLLVTVRLAAARQSLASR